MNSNKIKVHYHSDNAIWAGSEQMMIVFLTSEFLREHCEISNSYRFSHEYRDGRAKWFQKAGFLQPPLPLAYPLKFPVTKVFNHRWLRVICQYLFFPYDYSVLRSLFEGVKPDIVHINNGGYPGAMSCNAAAAAGKSVGAKVIYMANSCADRRFLKKAVEKPLDCLMEYCVDVFLTGSKENNQRLSKVLEGAWGSFQVMPNTLHLHMDLIPKGKIREWLMLPPDSILFCCVGAWEDRKGLTYLISAFRRLLHMLEGRAERAYLLLVGSGSLEDQLKKEAWRKWLPLGAPFDEFGLLNFKNRIIFIKDEWNAYSYINACDVYSYYALHSEDLSNTLLMAMEKGKPIIAPKVAGIPDLIDHGMNGYLVEPGQAGISDMARKMFLLATHAVQRQKFGEQNTWRYARFYSNQVILSRYLDLYHKLLGKKRECHLKSV